MQNVWNTYQKEDENKIEELCARYKVFLDNGKTERECVCASIELAEKAGYVSLNQLIKNHTGLKPGMRVYVEQMGKALILFQIGTRSLEEGMNILGAHIDSPRIDVKQNPLYEEESFAYLDTHYYGGIKKYQWVATPLAIHGIVVKKDGTRIPICIGEKDDDPVFVITDLLVHLSAGQMQKKAFEVIEGEKLDLLVGNRPLKESGTDEENIKSNVLRLLKKSYDMDEDDFQSAELEIVPAGKARDCGIDRSMILAYGQDDRICAFTSLEAMLQADITERTLCCILVDKEEVGSVGATGMDSRFFENAVAELMMLMDGESDIKIRRALSNSRMISSDVNAGYDPLFADAFEKRSSAFLGKGMAYSKFTGTGGKGGSNDANAEYIATIRRIMDEAEVAYQFAELGKVDIGGGGTIAYMSSKYGMEVIDSGVAILSMHAPYEVSSKADIYEAVKGYSAFLKKME